MKPLLLDGYCGAGGCSVGYNRAGFEVVGVDIEPQPNYPYEFHQADAVEFITKYGNHFAIISTSPLCQPHSQTRFLPNVGEYPDLIEPTRKALIATGKPYVIENVPGAPLINPLMLCGTMFGLCLMTRRLFETNPAVWFSPATCNHWGLATGNRMRRLGVTRTPSLNDGFAFVTVAGNNYLADEGRMAMGIDWMTKSELSQAIPPAYTEWLGGHLMEVLNLRHPNKSLYANCYAAFLQRLRAGKESGNCGDHRPPAIA